MSPLLSTWGQIASSTLEGRCFIQLSYGAQVEWEDNPQLSNSHLVRARARHSQLRSAYSRTLWRQKSSLIVMSQQLQGPRDGNPLEFFHLFGRDKLSGFYNAHVPIKHEFRLAFHYIRVTAGKSPDADFSASCFLFDLSCGGRQPRLTSLQFAFRKSPLVAVARAPDNCQQLAFRGFEPHQSASSEDNIRLNLVF